MTEEEMNRIESLEMEMKNWRGKTIHNGGMIELLQSEQAVARDHVKDLSDVVGLVEDSIHKKFSEIDVEIQKIKDCLNES